MLLKSMSFILNLLPIIDSHSVNKSDIKLNQKSLKKQFTPKKKQKKLPIIYQIKNAKPKIKN